MSTRQLSLFGIPAEAKPLDRLLLVLYPNAEAANRIARLTGQLCHQHDLTGTRIATALYHVTLYWLGDFEGLPKGIVDSAREAAATVTAPPFEVTFDRAMSFEGRPAERPFVLCGSHGVEGLTAFRQSLVDALRKRGLAQGVSHFNPHLTLIRASASVTEQPIAPVSWTVREFLLVHSPQGQGRHVPLARWSLKP